MTSISNQESARRILALAKALAGPAGAFAADHVKAAQQLGYRVGLIETSDVRYEAYAVYARPGQEIDPETGPLVAVILGDATRYLTMRESPRTNVAAVVSESGSDAPESV